MDDITMMILKGKRCCTCGKLLKEGALGPVDCKECSIGKVKKRLRRNKKIYWDIPEEKEAV